MEDYVFLNKQDVIEYLKRFGRGPKSHDYELSEAVRLKRFFELRLGRPFLIAIPIKAGAAKLLETKKLSKIEALRSHRTEDTDVDVLIWDAKNSNPNPRNSFDGQAFQIKKLNEHRIKGDLSSSLQIYLAELFKKYSSLRPISLYVIPDFGPALHKVDWKSLSTFASQNNCPFNLIVIGPVKNLAGEEVLVEIFPNMRSVKLA